MYQSSPVLKFIALIALAAVTALAGAPGDQGLESGLINALSLKKGTTDRAGDSGAAIRAYIRAGRVNKRPDRRVDYTDYYLLKQPAKFMGHELVMIEEEYMGPYVGCCVSPGAGVSVKVVGSTENLEAFARDNKCAFTEHVDLQKELRDVGIKAELPQGDFASLSCRERDAMR